jgi:hypothetical protein
MKIVFGSNAVETAQQQHIMSSAGNNSVWITLAASVPPLSDTRSDSNQVSVSVCLFDHHDPDLAIDTWDIGKFDFTSNQQGILISTVYYLLSGTYIFFFQMHKTVNIEREPCLVNHQRTLKRKLPLI